MSRYSEKQLLLLSNFVYLPCSLLEEPISGILNYYKDESGDFTVESVAGAGSGGGLSEAEIKELFVQMEIECDQDQNFASLSASRKLNDGYVKAICYTDSMDENAVIAFRGTGGSNEAWTDNFRGGYEQDTNMQRLAAEFVKRECGIYSNITVTGHSKGGNLCQYVTVECENQVDKCVSFDGQGFNSDFIEKNKEKIDVATPKIKSISAYNDYVNILLTSIAGTVMYVQNDATITSAHSSLALLLNNAYDENGNIISERNQSIVSSTLKKLTDKVVDTLRPYDKADKSILSRIAGKAIATALESGSEGGLEKSAGVIAGGATALFAKKMADYGKFNTKEVTIFTSELYYDGNGVREVIDRYDSVSTELALIQDKIKDVNERISKNITMKLYSERMLNKSSNKLEEIIHDIKMLAAVLEDIRIRYEQKETSLANYFDASELI